MKNIIICSDGTWQSPESDTSTHVLRLAEGIAPEDAAGNKQVVFYDWGVGSEGDKFSGGITGKCITTSRGMRCICSGSAAGPIPCVRWRG